MNNNFRVAIVTNIPSPYRKPLFREISKEHNLEVVFYRKAEFGRLWNSNIEDDQFGHYYLPHLPKPFHYIPIPVFQLVKRRDLYILLENNYDNMLVNLLVFCIAKLQGAKIALWIGNIDTPFWQNRMEERSLLKYILHSYKKLLYSNSDGYLCYSTMTKNAISEYVNSEDKIVVGGQIMPEELLPPPGKLNLNVPDEKRVILSLGYLHKHKGVQDLIESYLEIEPENTILVIAGTGPYEDELKKLASISNSILFAGYVDGQLKSAWYERTDLFVFPTYHDPWGHVISEALYFNNLVICSDKAGAKELLSDDHFIFTGGCVKSLIKVMEQAIAKLDSGTMKINRYGKPESVDLENGKAAFRKLINNVLGFK